MKKFLSAVLWIVCVALAFNACSNEDTGPSAGVAVVNGFVKDASTLQPLSGVLVQGKAGTTVATQATTDAQGKFELRFEIDTAMSATISIRNVTGYRDTLEISLPIKPNEATVRDIALNPKSQVIGSGGSSSGLAQTIAFLGANPQQISVYGVGGQETAVLGFEVRDSLGLPIDASHAIQLQFSIAGGINGGEYVSPSVLTTNAAGRAFVAFNSGVRAGVAQIVVTGTVGTGTGTRTISSSPVRVVINAGYADQAHFTIAPEQHNFPTLGVAGNRLPITVLVGDRYSNPVVQNTALYFHSSAGVVQPTVFTNVDGEGTANLISGNPAPFNQYAAAAHGDGYHFVVARTIGQGGVTVQDSTLILWSGHASVQNVTPASFSIPNGGFQDVTFKIADALGHPLAKGTRITVRATVPPPPDPNSPVNQVQLAFGADGSVMLSDVIFSGAGTTDFGFRISDGTLNINQATAVTVNISVDGPNGNAYATINGICN